MEKQIHNKKKAVQQVVQQIHNKSKYRNRVLRRCG